jgi:hypothetical protein
MNEFQLGLKLQLSGVDSAQTMLNGFTKSLDQQLTGIRDFTKKLGDGNETVRGYIDSAKEMIAQNPIGETMDKLSGLAKSLGLDQISTGISQTAETVRAWTGEITSFMGSAQGASATVKKVLEGDVNGALDSVKTGLQSMGNFADLATKMGLPGVATQINDIAANVGTWVGKVQEFQGATEATASKLDQAFGGSVHPNVLKVTSGILEMTGVSKDILPHIDGIQKQFQSLSGKSFPDAFKEMQNLSKEFGKGGMSAKNLAQAFKAPGGAARLLAGGFGIVGAAIAGWQIGKAIGEMNVFGVKINDVVQVGMTKLMGFAEKVKNKLGITSDDEYAQKKAALEATENEIYLNSSKPETAANAHATNEAAAQVAEQKTRQEELQRIAEFNEEKRLLEEELQTELEDMRREFAEKLEADKEELRAKDEEEDAKQLAAAQLAQENTNKEIEQLKEQLEKKEKEIELIKEKNKLLGDQAKKLDQVHAKENGEERKAETVKVGLRKAPARKGTDAATTGAGKADEKKKADPNSYRDQFSKVLDDLKAKAGTMAEQVAGLFQSTIGVAVDSIAKGITGLINGTMTWSQALQGIGDAILNNIITSFAKMAAQWIANQILMATVGKILGATANATSSSMATALAAAWAVPAFLASVASYGGAVAAGQGALSAGMAFTQGMALVSSASGTVAAAGGSAEGGLITGPGTGTSDSIPRWLSNGEFVIPAKRVEQFGVGFFEGIRTGSISARESTPAALSRGEAPRLNLAGLAPSVNVQSAQPKVIVVNSQEELMRVMKGSIGEEITVAHIAKNKLRLGMAS